MARTDKGSGSGRAVRARAVRMDRDERMSRILAVARDYFCKHGYHAAVVADISDELGVSEATIFRYFPTKQELLNRVIEDWYGERFGDYSKELAVIHGARNRFRYLVWRHLCTIRDWPDMVRLIFTDVRSQPGYPQSLLRRMNLRYTRMLLGVARDGVRAGEFRGDLSLELVRDAVYGGIEHHAWGYLYDGGGLDAEKIADQLTELICGGLGVERLANTVDDIRNFESLVERLERAVDALTVRPPVG